MKSKIFLSVLITLIIVQYSNAQTKRLSVGFVGSYFDNTDNQNKLTNAKDPYAYGIVLGYQLSNNVIAALTTEYSKADLENSLGTQKDLRVHLSAYYLPFSVDRLHPYLSAGFVFTNRNTEFESSSSNIKNFFNGRVGAGIDYSLIQNLNLNVDFGFYNNGYNFVGISSSIGLRYGLNLN
ncbi:MAG: outer membrane beta-barrel protein [bacterium]